MDINQLLETLHKKLLSEQKMLATAESCTGGKIAASITDAAGSSLWFERGYVTYSNQAKIDLLSVKKFTLKQHGAVSEEVAREMAKGCLVNSGSDYSLSVTGIAGPGGGSKKKPVGTVWFAWAVYQQGKKKGKKKKHIKLKSMLQQFDGDRQQVRELAVYYALSQLLNFINKN